MSLLQTKVLPTLSGKYTGKVLSFEEISNTQGGYIKVVLGLDDRTYTYNIFPTQVDYVTSALRNQFNMHNETVTLEDMLNKASKEDINIYFSYNQEFGRMNVAFHEPKQEVVEEDYAE